MVGIFFTIIKYCSFIMITSLLPPQYNDDAMDESDDDDQQGRGGGDGMSVSSWSDYLKVDYHPRSVVAIKTMISSSEREDHEDRLRHFLEECDAPQVCNGHAIDWACWMVCGDRQC